MPKRKALGALSGAHLIFKPRKVWGGVNSYSAAHEEPVPREDEVAVLPDAAAQSGGEEYVHDPFAGGGDGEGGGEGGVEIFAGATKPSSVVVAVGKAKADGKGRQGHQISFGRDKRGNIIRVCEVDRCLCKTGHVTNMTQQKASKHNIEYVRKMPDDGKERDKRGNIIRMCGVFGCSYKTGNTGNMARHKARKHNIEYVIKIPNDAKEREKWGNIVRMCGVDGCSYKTGNWSSMRKHKMPKHSIECVRKIPDDGNERDKWGDIIRVCGIGGCSYKTGFTNDMKKHKARKLHQSS